MRLIHVDRLLGLGTKAKYSVPTEEREIGSR